MSAAPQLPEKYQHDEWMKLTGWAPMPHQEQMYWAIVRAIINPEASGPKRFIPCWHRRAGKDSTAINALGRAMMVQPGLYYYCAPEQTQARKILFDNIDRYGRRVIDQAIPKNIRKNTNVAEMKIVIDGPNGESIFQAIGSDNYDSIVGTGPRGIIFSEFAIAKKPECWDFFRPMLMENGGTAVFPSTPRGLNHFYSLYTNGLAHKNWLVDKKDITQTTRPEGTPIVTEEMMAEERETGMSEAKIRQEFYCDFIASGDSMLYSMDSITQAMDRPPITQHIHMPLILGVDVARYGDDKTVFAFRRGTDMSSIPCMAFDNLSTDQVVDKILWAKAKFNVDMVFIDETGGGAGVADYAKRMRVPCRGINFASKAIDSTKYLNKRAEIHGLFSDFLNDEPEASLEKNRSIAAEASAIEYEYDSQSRIKLMDKQALKKKIGTSTDFTDACALTFSFPVPPKGAQTRQTGMAASTWE